MRCRAAKLQVGFPTEATGGGHHGTKRGGKSGRRPNYFTEKRHQGQGKKGQTALSTRDTKGKGTGGHAGGLRETPEGPERARGDPRDTRSDV
jgi:hypothetical protein